MVKDIANEQPTFNFLTLDKANIKDIKFSIASFLTILVIIFHWAWIMKQWLNKPDTNAQTLVIYFASFVGTVVGSITFLVKVVYKIVYAEELQVKTDKKTQ